MKKQISIISASGIIYKQSDPRQVFLEIKDSGYPVKVFACCLCFIGGNWVGDKAKTDRGTRDTFVREVLEELSFEKPLIDTSEYVKIGLAELTTYRAEPCKRPPTADEVKMLEGIKSAIVAQAVHFIDNVQHVPKAVFDMAEPGKRSDFHGLNSCWSVPLSDADWEILTRLQSEFGNLSNESLSLLATLDNIVKTKMKSSWGYDRILQKFFLDHGLAAANEIHLIPGVEVEWLGPRLASYSDYLEQYDIAKHP